MSRKSVWESPALSDLQPYFKNLILFLVLAVSSPVVFWSMANPLSIYKPMSSLVIISERRLRMYWPTSSHISTVICAHGFVKFWVLLLNPDIVAAKEQRFPAMHDNALYIVIDINVSSGKIDSFFKKFFGYRSVFSNRAKHLLGAFRVF